MPQDPRTRGFLIHLAVFLGVNAALAAIDLMRTPAEGESRAIWFVWPLFGWGIGVAAHGLALVMERTAEPGTWMADARRRGLAVHGFVYVAVNILLVVVDLTTSPGLRWVYWPILGWGAGLAAHAFAVLRRPEGPGAAPPATASPSPPPAPPPRPPA